MPDFFEIRLFLLLLLEFLMAVVIVVPMWRILTKAGLNKWLSLFAFIPPFAFAVLYYIAFARWPARENSK